MNSHTDIAQLHHKAVVSAIGGLVSASIPVVTEAPNIIAIVSGIMSIVMMAAATVYYGLSIAEKWRNRNK